MPILCRLTEDLSRIMEWQMTKERADSQRLCAAVLLLLGERRCGVAARNRLEAGQEEDEPLPETPDEQAALAALRAQVQAFECANPYLNGLLFRDYRLGAESRWQTYNLGDLGNLRIHAEAFFYASQVLMCRTLRPATRVGSGLTNLHKLLRHLCRRSAALGEWRTTDIRRDPHGQARTATWFQKVAKTLRERWRAAESAIAAHQQEASGAFWLTAGPCAEKVGDELTLQDVVEIAPCPIQAGFSADQGFVDLLGAVINSLNRRYGLLRTCGLVPEEWLHLEEPSINQLRQLAKLRERAAASDEWKDGGHEAAFRRAFAELLARHGKDGVGGFKAFERQPDPDAGLERAFRAAECARPAEQDSEYWLYSRVGRAMLARAGNPVVSASGWGEGDPGFDDEPGDEAGEEAKGAAGDAERAELLQDIVRDAGPRLAGHPVLHGFFQAVLVNQWTFERLWALPPFQEAVEESPRYAVLEPHGELYARLWLDAQALIFEVMLEAGQVSAKPALLEYLRWVVVEEKPFRGKGGLIQKPSFKALVAQDPALAQLTSAELEATLHRQALDFLEHLLARRG